jgi:hypothetical protein
VSRSLQAFPRWTWFLTVRAFLGAGETLATRRFLVSRSRLVARARAEPLEATGAAWQTMKEESFVDEWLW